MVRSFITRKKFKARQMNIDSRAKYFRSEESSETLTKRKFKSNEPLKTRKYEY